MNSESRIKKEMCSIGRRVYDHGMVAANDGNFSVKLKENEYLCTATGISKGFMTAKSIVKVDGEGNIIKARRGFGPSSEIKMHLRIYRERSDVKAIVHAHPLYATSFAVAGIPLDRAILPEAVITLGTVPIAAYGTPSTEEIPDAISPLLPSHDAILLENHGAIAYGDSLLAAYHKMESLEFFARILYQALALGTVNELKTADIERLYLLRRAMGLHGRHPLDGTLETAQ